VEENKSFSEPSTGNDKREREKEIEQRECDKWESPSRCCRWRDDETSKATELDRHTNVTTRYEIILYKVDQNID
jgi:hypothetical protein